jgi:riboflavin biosynthesis pyrimidine reductase
MTARILRLYPGPPHESTLAGTYLAHKVHRLGTPAAPFVYANFVSSLDGRIALQDPATGASHVPETLTSGNDFRLLLELQAQADCLITHGGYMRAIAEARLDDILQVGTRDFARDLAQWREENGLGPQPAVVIASASLDFPAPESPARHGQRVIVATGEAASAGRVEAFRARGYEVIRAGKGGSVEGAPLTRALGALGFRSLFLLAGPRMLGTMLRNRVLSRLYVTIAHCILGGEAFHTMVSGLNPGSAGRLRMVSLYYDATAPEGAGQWFAQFEPLRAQD